MEKHNHAHVFRNKDIDRIISQYGKKPPAEIREKAIAEIRSARKEFRYERFRGQRKGNAQGMGF